LNFLPSCFSKSLTNGLPFKTTVLLPLMLPLIGEMQPGPEIPIPSTFEPKISSPFDTKMPMFFIISSYIF
jgi:hypothetical protein